MYFDNCFNRPFVFWDNSWKNVVHIFLSWVIKLSEKFNCVAVDCIITVFKPFDRVKVHICSYLDVNFFCNLLVVIILLSTSQIRFTPRIRSQSSFKIFRLAEQEKPALAWCNYIKTISRLAGWKESLNVWRRVSELVSLQARRRVASSLGPHS